MNSNSRTSRWIFLMCSASQQHVDPFLNRGLTGWHQRRSAVFYTDQTHPAVAVRPQSRVVAEMRDLDAHQGEGVNQVFPRFDLPLPARSQKASPCQPLVILPVMLVIIHLRTVYRVILKLVSKLVQITAHTAWYRRRKGRRPVFISILSQSSTSRSISAIVPFTGQQLFDNLQHPPESLATGCALPA